MLPVFPLLAAGLAAELAHLAGMLGEELRSNRVHSFPVYWNVLAWAFSRVLAGKLDVSCLDYLHEMTLDTRGSGFLPECRFERVGDAA